MAQVQSTEAAALRGVRERVAEVIDDARRLVADIVDPACPTAGFLAALAEELVRATTAPGSAEFPELIEPDAYWEATVKPQSRSVRRAVAEVIEHTEARLAEAASEVESALRVRVDAAHGGGLGEARTNVVDEIAVTCQGLHHLMAEMIRIVPSDKAVTVARSALEEGRRRRAVADVEALKPAYLREAGGGEGHQRFAEQQWSETFAERVAHRDTLLRGEVPWRHQELAVVGHERTMTDVRAMVDEAVVRLQEPLMSMGERMVRRYDTGPEG